MDGLRAGIRGSDSGFGTYRTSGFESRVRSPLVSGWGRRRRRGGSLRGPLILDVVLLHLAIERGPIETQDLRRLLLIPVGALQRLNDRHLLDFREGSVRRNREFLRRASLFADGLGQIVRVDLATLADEHAAFDGVLELAYVTGPSIADEQVVGGRRDRADALLVTLIELREEVIAEERDVFGALPQRGDPKRHRVDAEIKVFPQRAL